MELGDRVRWTGLGGERDADTDDGGGDGHG